MEAESQGEGMSEHGVSHVSKDDISYQRVCSHSPQSPANDILSERLRRRLAKPMGPSRVGSNPTGVAFASSVWAAR